MTYAENRPVTLHQIEAAIVDIGDRIREERAAAELGALGTVETIRHGGLRDGLKEALRLIAQRAQREEGFYPPFSNAHARIRAELALVADDPPGTRVAVKADDLFSVVGHLELLRVALSALASGKADLVPLADAEKPDTIEFVVGRLGVPVAPAYIAEIIDPEAMKEPPTAWPARRSAALRKAELILSVVSHQWPDFPPAGEIRDTAELKRIVGNPLDEPPEADPRFTIAHDSLSNPTLAVIRKHGITDGEIKEATYHLSHAMRRYLRGPGAMARWFESREIWDLTEEWAKLWRRKGFPEWKNGDVAGDLEKLHRAIIADADGVAT